MAWLRSRFYFIRKNSFSLSSAQLIFSTTQALITCWPLVLKPYFLKLDWCAHEMYPHFSTRAASSPSIPFEHWQCAMHCTALENLPVSAQLLLCLSPTIRPFMAPYCLRAKTKNYRIKRSSWRSLKKSFNLFPHNSQVRKLRPREGKWFPQDHTVGWSWS